MKNDFKSDLNRLKSVTKQLESGNVSLNDSLKKLKQGSDLSRKLSKDLDHAHHIVSTIVGDGSSSNGTSSSSSSEPGPASGKSFFK